MSRVSSRNSSPYNIGNSGDLRYGSERDRHLVIVGQNDFDQLIRAFGVAYHNVYATPFQKRLVRYIKVIKEIFLNEYERNLFKLRFDDRRTLQECLEIMKAFYPPARKATISVLCQTEIIIKQKLFALFIVLANRKTVYQKFNPTPFEKRFFCWLVFAPLQTVADQFNLTYEQAYRHSQKFLTKIMKSNLSVSLKDAMFLLLRGMSHKKTHLKVNWKKEARNCKFNWDSPWMPHRNKIVVQAKSMFDLKFENLVAKDVKKCLAK